MPVDWLEAWLEAGLVHGMLHLVLLMLLDEHILNALGFMAMVGKLVRQAPLDWNNSWSIHVLHDLLTSSFLAGSTALTALFDQTENDKESNDWEYDFSPSAMWFAMVSWILVVLELIVLEILSRLCWIVKSHLVSNHGMICWSNKHHWRGIVASHRVILLMAVSVRIHFNRPRVLTGRRRNLKMLVTNLVSFVTSSMVATSPVTFMSMMLTRHRMVSIKFRAVEWLSIS